VEPDLDGDEQKLKDLLQALYGELMDIEIDLQEALNTSTKIFTLKINEIISTQKEMIQNYIANEAMSQIDEFCEKFYEEIITIFDRLKILSDTCDDDDDLEKQLSDYGDDITALILLN